MLDLAWSEIALIAVVALVVIGPKDLPDAIKGLAKGIQSLRRKIAEFQQQADELVREAKLDEVRNQIAEVRSTISSIRNFDLTREIEKHVDADGSVRNAFADPLASESAFTPAAPYQPPVPENAPAFVPPEIARWSAPPAPPPPPAASPAPAFVPPAESATAKPAGTATNG
jgi:sec-independent protein translocase protein TatB